MQEFAETIFWTPGTLMTNHRAAPRKEQLLAHNQTLVQQEAPARARRAFAVWLLLAALLIGLQGARVVRGDQALLTLLQAR